MKQYNVKKFDDIFYINNFITKTELNNIKKEIKKIEKFETRTYFPLIKKGSSISSFLISKESDKIINFYKNKKTIKLLSNLCKKKLVTCPDEDPHSVAIYLYKKRGDFVYYHRDISLYKGKRYVAILTVEDNSNTCFIYKINNKDKKIKPKIRSLVFFDGEKVIHKIPPINSKERRIVISMQYLTNQKINLPNKLISNIKDFIWYFGFQIFKKKIRH